MSEVVKGTCPSPSWRNVCVTIGNFDGVHLGHQELVHELKRMSVRKGTPGVALTFSPHPAEVLTAGRPQRLLPLEDRIRMLLAVGASGAWVLPFDRKLAALDAQRFVEEILLDRCGINGLVVGPDFRFGADRRGDSALLSWYGERKGFEVVVVPPLSVEGTRVSSSQIRRLLQEGQVAAAARFLGRTYRVKGTVVKGRQVGTSLGFPTANLCLTDDVLVPANGIYVVRMRIGKTPGDSVPLDGVANVGHRPTVDNGPLQVEAHLFGIEKPLYGESVTLEFLERIRDERKFGTLEELRGAIRQDVETARSFFARQSSS